MKRGEKLHPLFDLDLWGRIKGTQVLQSPAWCPMSYKMQVRLVGRNLSFVRSFRLGGSEGPHLVLVLGTDLDGSHCLSYVSGMFLLADEILVVIQGLDAVRFWYCTDGTRRWAVPKTKNSWLEWYLSTFFLWVIISFAIFQSQPYTLHIEPNHQRSFSDESASRAHDERIHAVNSIGLGEAFGRDSLL